MGAKETFLITGANGFIGGWLAETLHVRGGVEVRAGMRGWSKAVRLARFGLEPVLLDVMKPEQIGAAMAGDGSTHRGALRVIHTAYSSARVTVEGTRNVLEAALRADVARFVYLSTTEVYGIPRGEVDETYPLAPTGNEYGDSKIEAERLCWEYGEKGLPVTVVRPTIVYGPFGRTWTVEMAAKLQSGNWGVFEGYGVGICNLAYVSDLVEGILLAARHPAAVGQAFNLSGPEPITWNEYFTRFNAAMGLPALERVEPNRMRLRATLMSPVRSAARLAQKRYEKPLRRLAARFRPAKEAMLSAEKSIRSTPRFEDLELYNRDALYVTQKAQELLGYQPRVGVGAGLELTVAWLRNVGLVEGNPVHPGGEAVQRAGNHAHRVGDHTGRNGDAVHRNGDPR
ncbi:MAG: NAD-dependent epimerase/dehydratase family protein [Chloroflexi bacterium]|nr:MAG: NAD-dependent epimerase/dehydratase family protein [Chloroflexota bacterium]